MNMVNLCSRNKAGTSALQCARSNGIQPIKVDHSPQKKVSSNNISAPALPKEDSR